MEESGSAVLRLNFNAVVENLIDAMQDLQVPISARNGLIATLAPMHEDIVGVDVDDVELPPSPPHKSASLSSQQGDRASAHQPSR